MGDSWKLAQEKTLPAMPSSDPASIETLIDGSPKRLSLARKLMLLLLFGNAQFLDAFNNASIFPAIPAIKQSIGIPENQSAWIVSGFQLTFASFLLISGRISDVYNPKNTFITGIAFLGLSSFCAGFARDSISIIIFRAFMGIASAMSIPSALALLVHVFPDPVEQARAIAVFGGCGAFADVLGLFIGAALVQHASYHWVFWSVSIFTVPVALIGLFIIPSEATKSSDSSDKRSAKWKNLDLIGVSILTVALIFFIYAVTSGSAYGWDDAGVIVPLVISMLSIAGFFYWEARIPVDRAAIPPHTWFCNNFLVLFGSALLPFFWWNSVFLVFTTLWQEIFHWTAISTVVHMLPLGVAAMIIGFTGSLAKRFSTKRLILVGLSVVALATVLVATGGRRPENYWPCIFPAFFLGSAGTMLTYSHTNIAIFQATPASMAGTVGAIFNGALQFGSAIGIAAFSAIQTSVQNSHGGPQKYHGRAAAFWFLFGIVVLEILSVSYFYRAETDHGSPPEPDCRFNNDAARPSEKSRLNGDDKLKENTVAVGGARAHRASFSGSDFSHIGSSLNHIGEAV